jgi:hypothetical protein
MAAAEQSTVVIENHQQLSCPSNDKSISEYDIPINIESIEDKGTRRRKGAIDLEGETTIVRKRLGCRRSLQDMLSPEEQQTIKSGDDAGKGDDFGRDQLSLQQLRSLRQLKPQRRLIFVSPRVVASDKELFPTNHSLYKESSERWQQISEQAGSHRQDGTVMTIGRRPSSAPAFRMGMIACVAVRVRSLNLWLDHGKDTLPEWLKMIGEIFMNLEHLALTEDVFPGEDEMTVSARMRRLYVLSLLPNLKSIDDMVVTPKEREMANPGSYSNKHQANQEESQQSNSDSINQNECQDIDQRIAVSTDTDSVGSSSANGIEVEFHNMVVTPRVLEMANPRGHSDELKSDRDESLPLNSNHCKEMDSWIPVSIDIDSVGASRVNGIEVEFLSEKFHDVKHTETETTTSSSPTTNSESTITATATDAHFVFEEEDKRGGAKLLKDPIIAPPIPSIGRKLDYSHDLKNSTDTMTNKQFQSNKGHEVDSAYKFDHDGVEGTPTRSMNRHQQATVSDVLTKINKTQSDDDVRDKAARERVRAFHGDINNSVELASVASTDVDWSITCGILNFRRQEKARTSKGRPPLSSEETKMTTVASNEKCLDSAIGLWSKESGKENTNVKAYKPKSCTPVQRQSRVVVSTPQVSYCQILKNDPGSTSKFSFPTPRQRTSKNREFSDGKLPCIGLTANQKIPPSQSLSSPFPTQFLERQKPPFVSTTAHLVVKTSDSIHCDSRRLTDSSIQEEMETISSTLSKNKSPISSPKIGNRTSKTAQKGELPPPCPLGNSRLKKATDYKSKDRKCMRHYQRRLNNVLKKNARSVSVMDFDDEEEFPDNFIEDEQESNSSKKLTQCIKVLS